MKRILVALSLISFAAIAQDNKVPEQIMLKTETVNAVLQYLSQKPYAESAQLIARIQQESSEYVQSLNKPKDDKKKK
jgi:hypothetical protein